MASVQKVQPRTSSKQAALVGVAASSIPGRMRRLGCLFCSPPCPGIIKRESLLLLLRHMVSMVPGQPLLQCILPLSAPMCGLQSGKLPGMAPLRP